jgi:hypothetical protein
LIKYIYDMRGLKPFSFSFSNQHHIFEALARLLHGELNN